MSAAGLEHAAGLATVDHSSAAPVKPRRRRKAQRTDRHPSRIADWVCAAMSLGWGFGLLLPGETLASSFAYAWFLDRASEDTWGMVCLVIGLIRVASLLVNGSAPRGSPIVRGLAAGLGFLVWLQFAYAFGMASLAMGTISAGVWTHLVLAGADFATMCRASADFVDARRGHA